MIVLLLFVVFVSGCEKETNSYNQENNYNASEVNQDSPNKDIQDEITKWENNILKINIAKNENKKDKGCEDDELEKYKKYFINYNTSPLDDSDLYVTYKGFTITPDTTVVEILDGLGYPERLNEYNFGFYNTTGEPDWKYQWCLQYPDMDSVEGVGDSDFYIVIICEDGYHDEYVDDRLDGDIQFVHLDFYPTKRGLKAGDGIDKVARLYGMPDDIQTNEEFIYLTYCIADSDIWIALDKRYERVRSIYLEYLIESNSRHNNYSKYDTLYVVHKDESLWEIALRLYGDGERWREIYEWNKDSIDDPNLIFQGQWLELKPEA